MVEQIRLNSRRHHIDLGRPDAVFQKPLAQFRRYSRDVVRENRSKPVQAMSDAVGQPCRANEVVPGELVAH